MGDIRVPSIDYLSRDFDSLRADMIAIIPFFNPEWTDRNPSDFGITLIEEFAYVSDIMHFYIDRRAQNLYLSTAFTRDSVVELLKLIDYEVPGKSAAIADEQFTLAVPLSGNFTVPENSQVKTLGGTGVASVIFESVEDLEFTWESLTSNATATTITIYVADTTGFVAGQTVNVRDDDLPTGEDKIIDEVVNSTSFTVTAGLINSYTIASNARVSIVKATVGVQQGETQSETLGTSDGREWQLYQLSQTPVVEGAVKVFVTVGIITTQWTEVENLAESDPADQNYELTRSSDGYVSVRFGDGTSGMIPPSGSTITSDYRVGGGTEGNVGSNKITQLVTSLTFSGSPVSMSVTNLLSATGGAEAMTIDDAKFFGPRSLRALRRAVTEEDYAVLAQEVAGVNEAKAVTRLPVVIREIDVYVLPSGGYAPSQALLDEVQVYLEARNTAGMTVYTSGPVNIVDITLTFTIVMTKQYTRNQVEPGVNSALANFFSVESDVELFGKNVNLSDLMALLDRLEGVDHVNIDMLTLDPATTYQWISAPTYPATVEHITPLNDLDLIDQTLSVEFTADSGGTGTDDALYKVVNSVGVTLLSGASLDSTYTLSDGSLSIQLDSFAALTTPMRVGDLAEFRTSQYVGNVEIENYEVRQQGTMTPTYEETD